MSRLPGTSDRDLPRPPDPEPVRSVPRRCPPPGMRSPAIDTVPSTRDARGAQRSAVREALCEVPPGRVERAGRGIAQWGRYRLAADSVEALRVVGAFGVVEVGDLAATFESRARAKRALKDLEQNGVLRIERFRRGSRLIEAASLTRSGKRLMERMVDPREPGDELGQSYRAGPARSSQVVHDVAVYRAARREMQAIEASGARVCRIRTDDDLRSLVWRRVEEAKRTGSSSEDAHVIAAASLSLTVQDGKLTLPDVRIEYEWPVANGAGFVDLEVATPDYRQAGLRLKAAAGFRIYRMHADGSLATGGPAEQGGRSR